MKKHFIMASVTAGILAPAFAFGLNATIDPVTFQCCAGCTAGSAMLCKTKCPNCPKETCCTGCTATVGLCDTECKLACAGSSDCTAANVYCGAGKYCNTTTKACTDCPTPGTSDGGLGMALPITKCYIPEGETFSDTKGNGVYSEDCNYTELSIIEKPTTKL